MLKLRVGGEERCGGIEHGAGNEEKGKKGLTTERKGDRICELSRSGPSELSEKKDEKTFGKGVDKGPGMW